MKNSTKNQPASILFTYSDDRFYPGRSILVLNAEGQIDSNAAPRMTAGPMVPSPTTGQSYAWWAQSCSQGLPAVGGRYQFLRGAWLPTPSNSWNASASWGACAPSTGEAC